MNTILMDLGYENNAKFSQLINSNGDYLVCDLSYENVYRKEFYDKKYTCGFSYFTFCELTLKKAFSEIAGSKKNLLITNLDWYIYLEEAYFELFYIFSLILPLDPILIGKEYAERLMNAYGITFNRHVPFNPETDFGIDLQKRINEEISHKSEIAEILSIFSSYGMFLSFGKVPTDVSEIIKLKDNIGMPITYEEFVKVLLEKQKNYPSNALARKECISHLMIVREHNPVDLFIEKLLKEKA